MAISSSPRLGLTRWSADTDQVSRAQFDGDHGRLDDLVAMAIQGVALDRPAAAVPRRLYYATDTGVLSLDTGTAWVEVLTEPRASAAYVPRDAVRTTNSGNSSESTTSTTYADLATAGPAVTADIGSSGACLVILTAAVQCNSTTNTHRAYMSFAVSGASALAASDLRSLNMIASAGLSEVSAVRRITGLSAGSNTFTGKYRTDSGSGVFGRRELTVIPL
jgi:hypothetical protein